MPKSLRAILAKSKVVPLANESGCEREPAVASNKQKGSARKTRAAKQIMQSKNLVVAGSDLVNRGSSERFARQGTKSARILELLTGADGVTLDELIRMTDWPPHSIRGFLSGSVGKKMGLKLISTKPESGKRRYSVEI